MTNEELIAKYNPANAAQLSQEDLQALRNLSDADIDTLANTYPNTPLTKAYLILFDKNVPENKQLWQLSTWQNLRNVRKFSNRKNLIPHSFKSIFQPPRAVPAASKAPGAAMGQRVTVDLSTKEAAKQLKEGLQTKTVTDKKAGEQDTKQTGGNKANPAKTTAVKAPKGTKPAETKAAAKVPGPEAVADGDTPLDEQFTDGGDEAGKE